MKIINFLKSSSLRVWKDKFLKDAIVVSLFTTIGGAINFLSQIYLNRNLSKDDFGLLNTLISGTIVVTLFISTYKMIIVKDISKIFFKHDMDRLLRSIIYYLKLIALFLMFFSVVTIVFKQNFQDLFKIRTIYTVYHFIVFTILTYFGIVLSSFLQGLDRFFVLSLAGFIGAVFKFIFIGYFIFSGFSLYKALYALNIATGSVMLFQLAVIFFEFRRELTLKVILNNIFFINMRDFFNRISVQLKEFLIYLLPASLLVLLPHVDVILVRILYTPALSGDYSTAVRIGQLIYFLINPITVMFFSKVNHYKHQNKNHKKLLVKGFLVTSLMLLVAVSLINSKWVMTLLIEKILVQKYEDAMLVIRFYTLAMIPMVLNTVMISYYIALRKFKILIVFFVFPILQFTFIFFLAQSILNVVVVNIILGFLMLLIFTLITFFPFKRIKLVRD